MTDPGYLDTRPASLDAAGGSDPWAAFRVDHPHELLRLLRQLRDENVPVIVVCGKRLCRTCSRGDVRSGDTFRDAADETERDRAARYGGYSSSQRAGGWEPTDTYNLLREQDPEGPERPKRQPPRPRGRPRTAIPCQ